MIIITREEEIQKLLMKLKDSVESVKGASVISKRGLIISMVFDFEISSRMFGGIAASIVGPTERLANTLFDEETFSTNTIETEKGSAIIMDLDVSVLVVITKPNPNIGLILFEMEKTAKNIMEAMK